MSTPSPDIMNLLARSVLVLYADDPNAEDRSYEHEISTAVTLSPACHVLWCLHTTPSRQHSMVSP